MDWGVVVVVVVVVPIFAGRYTQQRGD